MRGLAHRIGTGLAAVGAILAAAPALAHPHVWIDTTVEVQLDDQDRVVAVRIGWSYDELYSLFVIGDMGLDPDGDDQLTPDEEAQLSGFDMKWIEGFAGDSYALLGETELALGGPEDWDASYAAGKITSTHLRRLAEPVAIGEATFLLQVYDPGYYTSYTIVGTPQVTGGSGACRAEVWVPDLDAADEALKAALAEYTPDQDLEAEFPAIGKAYSEEVRVTCGAP